MYNSYQGIDKYVNLHPSVPLPLLTYNICDISGFYRFTQMGDSIEDDVIDDGLQLSTLIEEETRDVIMDLFNKVEDQVTSVQRFGKILPTVEVWCSKRKDNSSL